MISEKEVFDLIEDYDIGMMTNINEDGNLVSHPMTRKGDLREDALWFFSKRNSEKIRELIKNNTVNISFTGKEYLSVSGIVEIVDDISLKKEFWSKDLEAFYEGGPESSDTVLIKLNIESLEYWTTDNIFKSAFEFVKGIVTDEKSDLGKHDALDL